MSAFAYKVTSVQSFIRRKRSLLQATRRRAAWYIWFTTIVSFNAAKFSDLFVNWYLQKIPFYGFCSQALLSFDSVSTQPSRFLR